MRNRWNQSFVAVLASYAIVFTGCASMQTAMTNVGNSLAFWKKSAPKDQFATNLTSPAATGTPTGAYGPNSMAQNQPSSYPFANAGARQNGSSQTGFGQSTNVASNTSASGTRSPYNTSYPSDPRVSATQASATQTQFGTGQPAARTASGTSNNFSGSNGSYSPSAASSGGFSSTYRNPAQTNTSTPSSQFQSSNAYQPSSGAFAPSPSPTMNGGGAAYSPAPGATPTPPPASSQSDYPETPYAKFGSTQTTTPSAAPTSSSFATSMPNPNMSSKSSFTPNTSSASALNPSPSTPITRPPSLPQSVFNKTGGYSPGSTGTSGTATQAGFESQDLYKPNTASKIPTEKSGLYTPGQ